MRRSRSILILAVFSCAAAMAGEPAGLREAMAKRDAAQNLKQHELYGSPLRTIDPSSYQFRFALVDLDGDGIPDAVVLMTDRDWCGSGGCVMRVLKGTKSGFTYVSGSTVSRAPIKALKETRHGWRSLSVLVAGGGAIPGEALMRFDGHRYPLNPSMQRYAKAKDLVDSTTLIHAE